MGRPRPRVREDGHNRPRPGMGRGLASSGPTSRQLPEARHKRLVLVAIGLLRRGDPPTLFAREGLMIAAIRSAILLRGGWIWRDADAASREVVREALRALGAKRPTWNEASTPHYAQADSFKLFERTRCRNCGSPLPHGKPLVLHCALRRGLPRGAAPRGAGRMAAMLAEDL